MKRLFSIILSAIMILMLCSMNAFAADSPECSEGCTHESEHSIEEVAVAAYPSCPNGSSHYTRDFIYTNTGGHQVVCRTCRYVLVSYEGHIWSVSSPTCTEAKYCVGCKYQAQAALGHSVYPTSPSQYVPIYTYEIDGTIHGHVCRRSGCEFNPDTDGYNFGLGYLADQPYGAHSYLSASYYTTYMHVTEGRYYHQEYKDCSYCSYTNYVRFFPCGYNNANCTGGCA